MQNHKREKTCFFNMYLLCIYPQKGKVLGGLLDTDVLEARSPVFNHGRDIDHIFFRVGHTCDPGQANPFHRPFLPASMTLLAVGMLQDRPVLRTTFEGPWEKSAGCLSHTGNEGVIIIISTVKTTSFFCVSCS
jgi:hypothetical protein